jgi:phage baseplate assembly protein W
MPPIGFTFPFSKTTGSLGYLETTSDQISAVKENIKSLLLTNWGERVMHANFGCNLIEFFFEMESGDILREKISDRIHSQISKWMPFVNIDDLVVLFQEDDPSLVEHAIGVHVKFSLHGRPDLFSAIDVSITQ